MNPDTTRITGADVKNLRERMNLTAKDFGELFGFASPEPRIYEIESGRIPVSSKVSAIYFLLLENITLKEENARLKERIALMEPVEA